MLSGTMWAQVRACQLVRTGVARGWHALGSGQDTVWLAPQPQGCADMG